MLCAPLRSHSARPAIASASASLTCYFTRVFAVRDLNQELTNYLGKKRGLGRRNNLQRSKAPIYPHRNLPAQSVPMAFILPGLRRSLLISAPLLISTPLLVQAYRRPVLCDGPDPLTKLTSDLRNNYSNEAQTPIIQTSGAPNPRAIRQISLGSILGLMAGLGVSVFSKPLALLIGLGVVCIQFLENRGIHLIPYSYLQRRFKATNVRSLIQDNVAFKFSFGATFALAAFAEF